MRRLLLVANPAASGFTASLHRDVVEILERTYRVSQVWPDGPAEARAEATAAAGDGLETVVAMGGDGVVHQVANGLIGSATALAVIPAGTTNVFRRVAGFPARPRDAAERIAGSAGTKAMEVLRITEGAGPRLITHVATFAAGVGFDAEVIRESERRPLGKIGFGALHYARSVLKVTLSQYRGRQPTLRVTGPGRPIDAVAIQFQVQDEFTYLSRLPLRLSSGPTPIATVVSKVTLPRMASVVVRAAVRGDLSRVRGIEVWEGFEQVVVEADPAAWVEADGELLGIASRVVAEPEVRPLVVVST